MTSIRSLPRLTAVMSVTGVMKYVHGLDSDMKLSGIYTGGPVTGTAGTTGVCCSHNQNWKKKCLFSVRSHWKGRDTIKVPLERTATFWDLICKT